MDIIKKAERQSLSNERVIDKLVEDQNHSSIINSPHLAPHAIDPVSRPFNPDQIDHKFSISFNKEASVNLSSMDDRQKMIPKRQNSSKAPIRVKESA